MNNRGRGGWQPSGRAAAEDGTPSKDKDGAYPDEITGFLQDVEAAEAAALQGGPGQPPSNGGGGSNARRPWTCGDLWWLLALPAAVMLLLFVREWRNGFGGTTAVIAKVTRVRLPSFTLTPNVYFAGDLDANNSGRGRGSQPRPGLPADVAALPPIEEADEKASDQLGGDRGPEAPTEVADPAPQPQQLDGEPAEEQQQRGPASEQPQGQQDSSAGPGTDPAAEATAPSPAIFAPGGGGAAEGLAEPNAVAAAAPEPGVASAGGGDSFPASAAPAAAPSGNIGGGGSGGDSQTEAAGPDSDAAGAQSPRPSNGGAMGLEPGASAVGVSPPAPGLNASAAAATLPDEAPSAPAGAATAAGGGAGDGGSNTAPAMDNGERQRTAPKVVVLPSHDCQLMDPGLEARCMANKASGAECRGHLFEGQYSASYLTPFVKIAPHMAGAGIADYVVNTVRPMWAKPGDGGSWDKAIAAADIVIVEEQGARVIIGAHPNKTLVVLQGNAAAALRTCGPSSWCAQHLLELRQVGRVLQHTGLKPIELNNAQRYLGLPHYHLMQQVHLDGIPEAEPHWGPAPGQPAFTSDMLARVQTLQPMFWRWRYPFTCHGQADWVKLMAPSLQPGADGQPPAILPPIAQRPIDVAFSGSVNPPKWRQTPDRKRQNEVYAAHRQALLDELAAIEKRNPSMKIQMASKMSYPEFVDLLRSTKIFISPLGHGEYSGKDYETVISRALLVKPLARHLESYPDIYEVNVTCAEVALDFRDMEAVLQGLLADPQRLQRVADAGYRRLVEFSDPGRVALDVADMLQAVTAEAGLGEASG